MSGKPPDLTLIPLGKRSRAALPTRTVRQRQSPPTPLPLRTPPQPQVSETLEQKCDRLERTIDFLRSHNARLAAALSTEKAKREEAERRVLEVQLHAQKSSSSGKAGWRAYFELKRTL